MLLYQNQWYELRNANTMQKGTTGSFRAYKAGYGTIPSGNPACR